MAKAKTNTKTTRSSSFTQSALKPPSAPEIEAAVLGAMLIEKESVPKAIEMLTKDSFYTREHQLIFEAMISLFESNEPIDTVTVYEELKKRNQVEEIGGAVYLSKLSQDISSAANVEFHCKLLIEKQILRGLISSAHQIAQNAYEANLDAFEILDSAERKIFEITETHLQRSFQTMDRAVRDALEYIEAIHSQKERKFSVPTGFYELDEILGGFQKSDLVIVAARPSMGKTAFALTLARNAAIDHKIPIGIFSLEMSTMQLIIRMLCAEGRLNAHYVRTGKLPSEEGVKLSKNAHKLIEAPLYVDDSPSQTVLEIRAKARRLKAEKNIGMIIIDYLQLMQGPPKAESREREISHISRSLKALAKELNIPVIALAQLNRAVETRSDKRPQLSDLRESGSIEQDADVVIFLNRPEYYGIEKDENGDPTEGIAEIVVGKQRNGPTGIVKLAFIKEYARFENLAHARQIAEYSQTPAASIEEDIF
ncbi:MAG: replicative DNA helicase [Ignavibacteriales bacterium UTCHB2]|nr:MAG: Replicative DNA helicase [Ignavibacteria bacterium ADurb.Bin266]OQY74100.1 MAG: replicative DNA helicase [Ignavibacteriales bacterium UTCHB2]HQJ45165.1 replicative DNA helicase [Ignavibacteriaceae bacterium]